MSGFICGPVGLNPIVGFNMTLWFNFASQVKLPPRRMTSIFDVALLVAFSRVVEILPRVALLSDYVSLVLARMVN